MGFILDANSNPLEVMLRRIQTTEGLSREDPGSVSTMSEGGEEGGSAYKFTILGLASLFHS